MPTHRVLIVDDNRDAADSLGLLLESVGNEVRVAHGGVEALSIVEDWLPSVLLLDIGMPEMDGFEVARRIRALPLLADISVIALSGWGQQADRERTQAEGFDHHLVKPVKLKDLMDVLDRLDPAAG